jgi:hypothetical protein
MMPESDPDSEPPERTPFHPAAEKIPVLYWLLVSYAQVTPPAVASLARMAPV